MQMPEVYSRQGFERHEIMNMGSWERQTGVVHEATSFNPGNEPNPDREPELPKHDPKVIAELAQGIAEAAASGWTGQEKLTGGV
jgi:hypothetical protein